jgi:hypothetical protein
MDMTNANRVCEMVGGYHNCPYCPIIKECTSNPKDPDHPADWEERMEKAATKHLERLDRLVDLLKDAPYIRTENGTDDEYRAAAAYLLRHKVAPPLVIKRKEKA